MEDKQSYDSKQTSVLSEEERRAFDGTGFNDYFQQTIPGVKVFTFSSVGWKGKLIMAALVVVLFSVLTFFGGLFLIGFIVLGLGVGIWALLRKLF